MTSYVRMMDGGSLHLEPVHWDLLEDSARIVVSTIPTGILWDLICTGISFSKNSNNFFNQISKNPVGGHTFEPTDYSVSKYFNGAEILHITSKFKNKKLNCKNQPMKNFKLKNLINKNFNQNKQINQFLTRSSRIQNEAVLRKREVHSN